jgi:hypothetical protein
MDLIELNSRRRSWQANSPSPNSERSEATDTISRCLALTPLEPQVALFLAEGIGKGELPSDLVNTLWLNIEDEERHELALTRASAALIDRIDHAVEANQIIAQWQDLPDNPITKTAVLECGVFFIILPIYAQFGTPSLRQSSNSISGDERLHVISHREAAKQLKARPSKALSDLRRDTVAWLSKSLAQETSTWNQERCLRNSESLMAKGVSDILESRVAVATAPYEINNRNMEKYA